MKNIPVLIKVSGIYLIVLLLFLSSKLVNAQQGDDYWAYGDMRFTVDDNNNDRISSFKWLRDGGDPNPKNLVMRLQTKKANNMPFQNTLHIMGSFGNYFPKDDRVSGESVGLLFQVTENDFLIKSKGINPLSIFSEDANKISLGDENDIVTIHKPNLLGGVKIINKGNPLADWDNLSLWSESESSHIESNGDEKGMYISSKTGNKISLGDDNDEVTINAKNLTLNYGSLTDLAQVSINTDKKINNASLTIAGSSYIGPQAEKAAMGTLDKFKQEYLDKYNLWVEDGIVTEDVAIVSVNEWKDIVFSENYKLKSLEDLESYIKANKHLPGVKSEAEVKKEGYSIKKMDIAILEKIEELVLYTIEQEKQIKSLKKELEKYRDVRTEINKINQKLRALKK